MFRHHVKLSLRGMSNNKVFSLLNIAGFAAGFAVCMVLALYAYKEYTVDTGFKNHENIYRVINVQKNTSRIDFDVAKQLKEQFPEVTTAIPLNYVNFGAEQIYLKKQTGEDVLSIHEAVSTTNDFFDLFSVKVLAGTANQPFADPNSVVIPRSTAMKLFGRIDVVGEMLNMSNIFQFPVSAVVEDLPANSSFGADLYLDGDNEQYRFSRSCYNGICFNPVDLFVLLNAKADPMQLATVMNTRFPVNKSRTDSVYLQRLSDIYLNATIEGNNNKTGGRSLIRIFLSIALLIMLLSVINYVNFSLSKQLSTLKEIGIKITNGAGLNHLKAFYVTDVAISVFFAFLLALGITWVLLPYAEILLDTQLSIGMLFSPALLGVFSLITLAVILISSFGPVYILSRFDVQKLFGKKGSVHGKQVGKKMLTVFQLVTTMALLIGLMVIQKQLHYVKSADLGFDKERLLRLDIGKNFKNQEALKQQLERSPFVQSISFGQGAPGSIYTTMTSDLSDKNSFDMSAMNIDNGFLNTFGVPLVAGREFIASDLNNSCYINETAYKRFGWDNLDNRIVNNEGGYAVVGVVRDFNVSSLHNEMPPVCLRYLDKYTSINIKLAPGDLTRQMETIRNIWKELVPETPMAFHFYDSWFEAFYQKETRQGEAIAIFSIIAFVITCLGLLGQIFQTCQTRIKEIGVRKVNGAKVSEVMLLLNKDFIALVAVAFVVATPLAWYGMTRWLEAFAYKTPLSWWIFIFSGTLALCIALLTVSWQSWKAATRNPVESLRYE